MNEDHPDEDRGGNGHDDVPPEFVIPRVIELAPESALMVQMLVAEPREPTEAMLRLFGLDTPSGS